MLIMFTSPNRFWSDKFRKILQSILNRVAVYPIIRSSEFFLRLLFFYSDVYGFRHPLEGMTGPS